MVKLKKPVEGSLGAQPPVGSIGGRLKSARENKGLSLEEVHRITKIHPKTIEALEKGEIDNKLGETYARAFLKNYSTFLGLDAGVILAEYVSKKDPLESRKEADIRKEIFKKGEKEAKKDNVELLRAVMTIAVIIASLFILTLGAVKIGQRLVSYKKTEPSKEIAKGAEKREPPAVKEEKIIPIPKAKILTLTLDTSNDVWLKVIVDGKVAFHKTLSKKSKETWKAEKEIRLAEIGKPEALSINVNGKDIDLSKSLSRTILITQDGVDLKPR